MVLVLGVLVLYWFNTNLTGVTVEESSGRRMWIVQGGDTFKLSADEVGSDDRYRCEVDGGAYTVKGTPPSGAVISCTTGRWEHRAQGAAVQEQDHWWKRCAR